MLRVEYRWHPHFSLAIRVRQPVGENGEQLLCELTDGARIVIPRWMTEAAACAGFSEGSPQVSVTALRQLRELLDRLVREKSNTDTRGSSPKSAETSDDSGRSI